jgi:hypothetical protein
MPGSLQWGVIPVGAGARAAAKLLRELAGSHRLLVHVYYDWTDADAGSASWARSALSSAEPYCRLGFPAELAVRYRSEQGNYLAYAQAVGRLAALATQSSCVVSLQVTNEANFALSKPTSDGAYPSAELALVKGVEASKAQVEAGRGSLRVGFNLAYLPTFSSVPAFLASLNAAGGPASWAPWTSWGSTFTRGPTTLRCRPLAAQASPTTPASSPARSSSPSTASCLVSSPCGRRPSSS